MHSMRKHKRMVRGARGARGARGGTRPTPCNPDPDPNSNHTVRYPDLNPNRNPALGERIDETHTVLVEHTAVMSDVWDKAKDIRDLATDTQKLLSSIRQYWANVVMFCVFMAVWILSLLVPQVSATLVPL